MAPYMVLICSSSSRTVCGDVSLRVNSSAAGAPIDTPCRRYSMGLATSARAEACSSRQPVHFSILAALAGVTPLPGSIPRRPAACSCNFFNIGIPCSAVAACPEVRMRLPPRSIICSSAPRGSRHRSNARWNVMFIPLPPVASISRRQVPVSMSPSGVKAPITIPSHPHAVAAWMSSVMHSISEAE